METIEQHLDAEDPWLQNKDRQESTVPEITSNDEKNEN